MPILSILDGQIDRSDGRSIQRGQPLLLHALLTRVDHILHRRGVRMPSKVTVVSWSSAAPPTQSHSKVGRKTACVSSKANLFPGAHSSLLFSKRLASSRSSPRCRSRKHLQTSAISAPELGTPDAMIGTVLSYNLVSHIFLWLKGVVPLGAALQGSCWILPRGVRRVHAAAAGPFFDSTLLRLAGCRRSWKV